MGLGLGKILTDSFLSKGLDVIKKVVKDKDQAEQLEHDFKVIAENHEHDIEKAFIADRQDARAMYKHDDKLQKVFSIVFLVGYILITFVFLYGVYQMTINKIEFDGEAIAIVTMLFTAMSNKINTIVDFLFGGSKSKE